MPNFTVVIPAYNEAKRICGTVERIKKYFDASGFNNWSLLLVDDGSSDGTEGLVKSALNEPARLEVVRHPRNLGKGAAVRTGLLKARGDYILFLDTDSSTPIEEFGKFKTLADEGADIIIGSRRTRGAFIEERQPFIREFLGKGFTLLSNLILGTRYSDFTCGFKCFKKEAARELCFRQRIVNWSYDSELLFLASRLGYIVKEVPVRWKNDPDSKVRLLRDTVSSFWGLLRVRLNWLTGVYDL